MSQKNQILPGTDAWESICEQCGLCCLLKTVNEYGRVCLTRVRCRHLGKNRLCDCYNMNFSARNDGNFDSCFKSNGSPVNFDTLCNDYVVPGFCPYVKRFVAPNKLTRVPISILEILYPKMNCPMAQICVIILFQEQQSFLSTIRY